MIYHKCYPIKFACIVTRLSLSWTKNTPKPVLSKVDIKHLCLFSSELLKIYLMLCFLKLPCQNKTLGELVAKFCLLLHDFSRESKTAKQTFATELCCRATNDAGVWLYLKWPQSRQVNPISLRY
jgi:hypothetical protein